MSVVQLGDLVVGTDGWCSPVADMGDERPGHSHADCYSGCGVYAGQRCWDLRERSGFAGHGGPGRARCQGYGAGVGRFRSPGCQPSWPGMMKEILRAFPCVSPSRPVSSRRAMGSTCSAGVMHRAVVTDAARPPTAAWCSFVCDSPELTFGGRWRCPGRSRSFTDVRGTRRQARVVSVSAESGSSFVARTPTGTPTCLFHRSGTRPHRVHQRVPVCARAPPVRWCAPRSSPFGVPR